MKKSDAHFYKMAMTVNPSVWFRNVMYSETVLDYFIHQSPFTRVPRIEQLMQFFACPPIVASLLKLKSRSQPQEASAWLKVRSVFFAPRSLD